MRFQDFTKDLEALENTSGRIEMYRLLGELFQRADADETRRLAYLCEGRLLPAFAGVETGMGERTIEAAIVSATKRGERRVVVTVLADEITRSPVHTAGRDAAGRGLALRFPRVVGFVREDKSAEDATTTLEIEKMYVQQTGAKKSAAK